MVGVGLLRAVAWLVALVVILALAVNLVLPYVSPPEPPREAVGYLLPAYRKRVSCPEDCPGCGVYVIRLDPRLVVDYYGLTVEGGSIAPRYTNTTLEAFQVLPRLLNPAVYYTYYSILTALLAFSTGREGTVYELHPLPLSNYDVENITTKTIYVCTSPAPVYVPGVRPAPLASSSVELAPGLLYFPAVGWANTTVVRNVVTYPPTAQVVFSTSREVVGELVVEGYADAAASAELLGLRLCYSTTYQRVVGNSTYEVVEEHYCGMYRVDYSYRLGLSYGGTAEVSEHRGSTDYEVSPWGYGGRVAEAEGGYFRGFGPFARVGIYAEHYAVAYCVEEVNGTCVRYSVDHLAEFRAEASTRSAVFRAVAVRVVATLGEVWTGVLGTMEALLRNSTHYALVKPSNASTSEVVVGYPWEEREGGLQVWLVDRPAVCGGYADPLEGVLRVDCLNLSRYVLVANASVRLSRPRVEGWEWGTTAVVEPSATVVVWTVERPNIDLAEVGRLLEPNPGEVWLQELTLRYLHDRLREIIASTPMSRYPDAYLWLLSAQVPVAMRGSGCHGGAKPLYDALVEGGGCELERCTLLARVVNYSVPAWIDRVLLAYPSLGGPYVDAYATAARLGGYPELWELYSESKGLHYAEPADGGWLVYYNMYENTVFCDWRRVAKARA